MLITETKITTTINQIESLMQKHFSEFEFTQMVENDSYVSLPLDDIAIQELKEDIEWKEGKDCKRYKRLLNQLNLVTTLREMGYKDEILLFLFLDKGRIK